MRHNTASAVLHAQGRAARATPVTTTNCARFVDSVVERITRYLDGDVSHIANPEALAARQSAR